MSIKPPNCKVYLSDGDGNIDLLLPVCTADYCEESYIYVYSSGQVHVHLITLHCQRQFKTGNVLLPRTCALHGRQITARLQLV